MHRELPAGMYILNITDGEGTLSAFMYDAMSSAYCFSRCGVPDQPPPTASHGEGPSAAAWSAHAQNVQEADRHARPRAGGQQTHSQTIRHQGAYFLAEGTVFFYTQPNSYTSHQLFSLFMFSFFLEKHFVMSRYCNLCELMVTDL